jgi:TM2 domain-containing membrane protein YozV
VAAFLTWLLPGLGHIYIGHKARGIIFMTVIAVTFWGGVAIGGVKSTVLPKERQAWFIAQVCNGAHTAAVLALATRVPDYKRWEHSPYVAYAPAADIAVVYTGVAGLLNVLVIFDVLGRGRATGDEIAKRAPPAKGGT